MLASVLFKKKSNNIICIGFLFSVLFSSCNNPPTQKADTLFELLPSDSTGIDFQNTITINDSVTILNYEYLYNGGGVAIGDFDHDSLPDIFLTGNIVPCRLYRNKGNLKFDDVTESSGIDTKGVWAYGVSVI